MTDEAVTMSGNVTSDPPAEPVLTVDTREELVYLLGQACEIEHGLMCEYLYAQFSLKRALDEGLTEGQLARVQAREKALISVIKQEMLHLALATGHRHTHPPDNRTAAAPPVNQPSARMTAAPRRRRRPSANRRRRASGRLGREHRTSGHGHLAE
jgi:hypothetical protein